MSLTGGQPIDPETRLVLLNQQLDSLETWFKRAFIGSWVVIAVATGFLVYSHLPSQLKPLADRLDEINGRLKTIETKLDAVREQIPAIATQLQELRSRTAKPVTQPKTPPSRRIRKRPANR